MSLLERSGEQVARITNRRTFLRQAATVTFSFAAAWAIEIVHLPTAESYGTCQTTWNTGGCSFSLNCTSIHSTYCSGHNCNTSGTGCKWDTGTHTSTACWCTDTICAGKGSGYYVCCDCYCPNPYPNGGQDICGCSQFVNTGICAPQD